MNHWVEISTVEIVVTVAAVDKVAMLARGSRRLKQARDGVSPVLKQSTATACAAGVVR